MSAETILDAVSAATAQAVGQAPHFARGPACKALRITGADAAALDARGAAIIERLVELPRARLIAPEAGFPLADPRLDFFNAHDPLLAIPRPRGLAHRIWLVAQIHRYRGAVEAGWRACGASSYMRWSSARYTSLTEAINSANRNLREREREHQRRVHRSFSRPYPQLHPKRVVAHLERHAAELAKLSSGELGG